MFGGLGFLSAGAKVLGGATSWILRRNQLDRAKDSVEEQYRRTRLSAAVRVGEATAAAGASGLDIGSTSLQDYLSAMAAEYRKQADFAYKMGMDDLEDARLANNVGLATEFAGAAMSYGSANNWFQTSES